jgi:hypothetical protein
MERFIKEYIYLCQLFAKGWVWVWEGGSKRDSRPLAAYFVNVEGINRPRGDYFTAGTTICHSFLRLSFMSLFFLSLSFLGLSFLSLSFLSLSFLSLSFLSLSFLSLSFLSLSFLSLSFLSLSFLSPSFPLRPPRLRGDLI